MTTDKRASHTPLVERLRMIRGAQFTPLENELVGEAAYTIAELLEALERILSDEEVALSRPDHVFARAAIAKARGEA